MTKHVPLLKQKEYILIMRDRESMKLQMKLVNLGLRIKFPQILE